MKVNVQYYGMIAELIQKDSEEVLLDFEGDALNIKNHMEFVYPELKEMTFQVAIDQVLKNEIKITDEIKEIALLPPFAGG